MAKDVFRNRTKEYPVHQFNGQPSVKTRPIVQANIGIGTRKMTVATTDDIQKALDSLEEAGGGTLELQSGTYLPSSDIYIPNSTRILGANRDITLLKMNGFQFIAKGINIYTDGTISSVGGGGVVVTGSSTSWLANADDTKHIFIDNRWYKIAAVTGNTTIILAEPYKDAATFSGNYRIANISKDIILDSLTIKDSTTTALVAQDISSFRMDNVLFLSNNKGFTITNYSFATAQTVTIANSTSNGYEITNGQFFNGFEFGAFSNGGHGGVLNTAIRGGYSLCAHSGNTGDGINMTDVDFYDFKIALIGNGGQGMEMVSGCDKNLLDVQAIGNVSDGVKLTATSDQNRIMGITQGNGGYGVNIAASTDDDNVILAPIGGGNSSGDVNDSGTGTIRIQETDTSSFPTNIFFGDGSDGNVTISSNTTLTRDMYYNNLTIADTFTLNTANFDVYVMGTLTQQGTGKLANNGGAGGNGGNASGATGGSAGTAGSAVAVGTSPAGQDGVVGQAGVTQPANNDGSNGVNGTNGSAVTNALGSTGKTASASGGGGSGSQGSGGSAGTNGTGGAVTGSKASLRDPITASVMSVLVSGTMTAFSNNGQNGGTGSGAGGGGNTAVGKSGGGGGGSGGGGAEAGFMAVFAKNIVTVGTNTFFQAKGGAGGNGGNGGDGQTGGNTGGGGGGAGGTGGNGGIICIVYKTLTGTMNTDITAGSVGTGGTGGNGQGTGTNGSNGSNGTTGFSGSVFEIQL